MRPAAYAMSLWPFSSSTSNIALGRACETVASMTTACSFWSPSSRSVRRAFGVRVPRRGPRCFPKSGTVYRVRMAFPCPASFRDLLRLATVDITPLRRHREYRLLYFGRFVSLFGNQITFVAVPYQVYVLTRSTAAVGLLGVVELFALLCFALLGGALADARDRRLMVLLTEAGLMVGSVILFGNALLARPVIWLVFVIVSLQGALDSLQGPSLSALLPRLVDREELTAAAALNGVRSTLGMIAGPALAGVIIAVAGLPAAYVLDIATFVVGLACLWLMRAVPPPIDAERPSMRRVVEGLRYARSRPELMGTYIVDVIAMFFGMPIALGSFLFTATSGWTNRVHRHGAAVIVAATLWGLAIVAFGFAPSLVVALLCLVAAGAADMMSGVFRNTIWNQTIPDSLRGRLASIEMLSFHGGPLLGNFESGVVASLFSVRVSVVSGGVLCVVGCVLAAVTLPAFWRYDERKFKAASVQT